VLYDLFTSAWVSETEVEGTPLTFFPQEGVYDLELENGDGQLTIVPGAVTITP